MGKQRALKNIKKILYQISGGRTRKEVRMVVIILIVCFIFGFIGWSYWLSMKPGLEIDLSLTDKNFFKSCTSWSNMPNFYDDCVTAGVSEYGTGTSFGIGTYDLRDLDPDTTYFGGWSFTLGTATTSEVKISWQEVWKDFCPFANPWCMNSVDGGRFLTSQFEKGQSKIVNWYY